MYKKADLDTLKKSSLRVGVSVHDPSVVETGGKYYIFGSHMASAVSDDLIHWTEFSKGVSRYNKLFDNLFTGNLDAFKYVGRNSEGSYSVWAPDVIYNPHMGKWMMYFCTTSTYIKSNLCFATADSIEGPYSYKDTILYSGFTRQTIGQTDVEKVVGKGNTKRYFNFSKYKNTLWPNAIDPAVFFDKEGRLWMVYGSWSGGIFILELDKKTGYPIHPEGNEGEGVDPYFGKHLAGGLHNSVEGPYVLYDKVTGYYYLFVSYGSLVSNGGYQIRLFRSKNPDGPYVDKKGETLDQTKIDHSKYGVKLMGNYFFPSFKQAYMSPGHNSALINQNGEIYLVHHTRFDDGTEYHEPRVRRMFRTADGWLAADPFAYNRTEVRASGLTKRKIAGYYYTLNHGTAIGPDIAKAVPTLFTSNGKIFNDKGEKTGSWKYSSSSAAISIITGGEDFEGVVLSQQDEAGNDVLVFTALSDKNESLWGTQYK